MRLAPFALVLLLCACAVAPSLSYRDTGVPIGISTRFDLARFAGDWQVRAAFGEAQGPWRFVPGAAGPVEVAQVDEEFARYELRDGARMVPVAGGAEIWVLWVDPDYRTAALGNAEGSLGVILDRRSSGGADRILAAEQILAWRGYDMDRLNRVSE